MFGPCAFSIGPPLIFKEVQEVVLKDGEVISSRRPVRPIPDVDYFFENQWRAYRKRTGTEH